MVQGQSENKILLNASVQKSLIVKNKKNSSKYCIGVTVIFCVQAGTKL